MLRSLWIVLLALSHVLFAWVWVLAWAVLSLHDAWRTSRTRFLTPTDRDPQ